MRRLMVKLVIACSLLVCCAALTGLLYIIFHKADVVVTSGQIVSAPSPLAVPAVPAQPIRYTYSIASSRQRTSSFPSTINRSDFRILSTAHVSAHSIGGGQCQGQSFSSSSTKRGITYAHNVMPLTTFTSMASVRQMALPEAHEAPLMAKMAASPHRAPGPPDLGGDDPPPGDEQLIEHPQPIGNAWILVLFGLIYMLSVTMNRKKE